jgi:hypothetical protein
MNIEVTVFWIVTPCSDVVGYQRMIMLPYHYTVLQSRKSRPEILACLPNVTLIMYVALDSLLWSCVMTYPDSIPFVYQMPHH